MRGLSERAPQFLRDCGEEGGSRHARLWFLPTVLLLVRAGLDHSTVAVSHSATWTCGQRMTSAVQGGSSLSCELIHGASLSLIVMHLDCLMVLDTKECPC